MEDMSLAALPLGAWAVLRGDQLDPGTARRLQELGLVQGEPVGHLYTAPAGSPMAFAIRGAVIALRTRDCRRITVAATAP